jgi:hypothetical protein
MFDDFGIWNWDFGIRRSFKVTALSIGSIKQNNK